MSIESLQKAADAAGYAMATEQDDLPADIGTQARPVPKTQALALYQPAPARAHPMDAVYGAATWIRDHLALPGSGRAPA